MVKCCYYNIKVWRRYSLRLMFRHPARKKKNTPTATTAQKSISKGDAANVSIHCLISVYVDYLNSGAKLRSFSETGHY